MRLCNFKRINELIELGKLQVHGADDAPVMLDDFRIGLRLEDDVDEIQGAIDLSSPPDSKRLVKRKLSVEGVQKGDWLLGRSIERLSISNGLFGLMNTRSKYARFGFELMGSSLIVAPGFGLSEPTSVIFEITARSHLTGFDLRECYGFLCLFDLEEEVASGLADYARRFPFK